MNNALELGGGIYTLPDISRILRLPTYNIRYWMNEFWDRKFSSKTSIRYSWGEGKNKFTNFHALIEFYVFSQLRENGISVKKILTAHEVISDQLSTPFPFATSNILTDGKRIFFTQDGEETIIHADKTVQITISKFIKEFCKKIDFNNSDNLAERYWPLGKKNNIVVDPHHQFGQPVISNTNILAETIYLLHKGGDSTKLISNLYDIDISKINNAIDFYKKAA